MGSSKKLFPCLSGISLLAALCALLSIPCATASAQGIIYGSIGGTVTDQTGAVIPNATVTAVNNNNRFTLQGKSTAVGDFFINNVPIGSYTVTIESSGFGKATVSSVLVAAGNTTSLGKQTLAPTGTAETVQVEAGAAELVNTESAQGEAVISTEQLQSLPVNGAMDNVTLVVPGVVQTHSDAMSNTNGVNYSVNGERGRSNNSEIDGQSNNDNMVAGPSFFFSNQDAVQELQIITNDFSAQYGRNMGSVVNYITKSGTNTFHGSGFEMYTGSFLSSLLASQKDPQYGAPNPPIVPRFVQNNYGGTLGGPILKDKLFFFGSTFWVHEYQAGSVDGSGGAVLPDATGLSELKSAFPNSPIVTQYQQFGPQSNTQGNPGFFGVTSTIPVTDGSKTADIEVAQFKRNLQAAILDQEELGRIDYQMDSKDRFYIRYNYQNNPFLPAFYLYGAETIAAGGYSNVNGITHQVGGDWTRTFTPALVNQLRYGFQQSNIAFEGGTIPDCTITSFGPCSSTVSLGSSNGTSLGTFGYGGAFPQGRFIKVNQVQDNASWTRGRHTVVFGMEFDHQDSPAGGLSNLEGSFNFSPGAALTASGSQIPLRFPSSIPKSQQAAYTNGLTGALEGVAQVSLTQGNPTVPFKEPDLAFYFQDNWKATSQLTVDLGLRYEFFGQSVNLLHNESVAQQTGPNPFWNKSLPLSATTFPYINPDYRNVEPRIGLAYSPDYARKMVVHAGFAINVDPAFYNIFLNGAQSAPLVNSGLINCDGVSVQCEPSSAWTFSTVQAQDDKYIPTGGDPRLNPATLVPTNFRNPMAETYTLGVQYQVFPAAVAEVRYVGNHTFGQFQSLNSNPDIADVQSYFPSYGSSSTICTTAGATGITRPDCTHNAVDTVGNTAFSIYNGLQTSLTLHNFHNITGVASYTFSRAIDNVSEIFSTGSGGTTNAFAQNPLDPNIAERGVSGNSYPSVWGIQMQYNEPWFSNQGGVLGRVLGGYYFNAFYQYNGGQPFSPLQNVYPQTGKLPVYSDPTEESLMTTNFCDLTFIESFVGTSNSQCRPILDNPNAPYNSVGINVGHGNYVDYTTGTAMSRDAFRWLWNNKNEAIALHNPFPGVGRNTLRGDSFNNLDISVGKNIKLTERVNMLLQMSAFDAMNRAYYGTPDANLEDSDLPQVGFPNTFLTNYFSGGGGGSAAAGGAYFQGSGNRNIQLTGKITF